MRQKGVMWPIAVAIILAITVGVNFWVLHLAGSDPSFAVEPDYYRKAVHWDDEMAQQRANAALGWTLAPRIAGIAPDGEAPLVVALTDSSGRPVTGATVRVTALHVARASHTLQAALVPDASDAYRAELPLVRPGWWELHFDVSRGGERFTAIRRIDVPAAPHT